MIKYLLPHIQQQNIVETCNLPLNQSVADLIRNNDIHSLILPPEALSKTTFQKHFFSKLQRHSACALNPEIKHVQQAAKKTQTCVFVRIRGRDAIFPTLTWQRAGDRLGMYG